MPKQAHRRQMLARRRSLGFAEWSESSRRAQQKFLSLEEYALSGCIALYAPLRNETDTELIAEDAFAKGKLVLYPAICGAEMVLRQIDSLEDLHQGCFGIPEPCHKGTEHLADSADLIIVPGVVFDSGGHRIGYGKGFYDRFLKHPDRKAHLIGLCHDFQLIDIAIPADTHDIRMEVIVTDRRIIRCRGNRSHVTGPN